MSRGHFRRLVSGINGGRLEQNTHTFRVPPTEASSDRYGDCEICHGRVSDVWHQVRFRFFAFEHARRHYQGWAYRTDAFGHEACLRARQQQPNGSNPCPEMTGHPRIP